MFTFAHALALVVWFLSTAFSTTLAGRNLSISLPSVGIDSLLTGNDRIFGGDQAEIGQFPYQVSLRLDPFDISWKHYCGGSIISNRFVITAGHCYKAKYPEPKNYRIVAGAHRNNNNDGIAYDVKRWIVHEGYYVNMTEKISSARNDIALVKTAKAIEFNNLVASIALHRKFFEGGAHAVTSGWGRSNVGLSFRII